VRHSAAWIMAAVLVVAGSPIGRVAWACLPSYCDPATVFPKEGETVPANLPAVVVFPQQFSDSPYGYRWIDSSGTEVDFTEERSLGYILLRPAAPLAIGETYTVSFNQGCPDLLPASTTFMTGPEADIPAEPPTVALESVARRFVSTADYRGDCTESIPASVATLAISIPGGEAHPFLATAVLRTFVDGALWARSKPGDAARGSQPWWGMPFGDWKPPKAVFAGCSPLEHVYPGLEQGIHQVTASLVVPGQSEDPLVSEPLEVFLSCNRFQAIGPTREVAEPAGPPPSMDAPRPSIEGPPIDLPAPTADAASADVPQADVQRTDATPVDVADAMPEPDDAPPSSTCVASPRPSPTALPVFLVILVLLALARRAPERRTR